MPKPVLSDSLFNAGDVATAVLNEADLQITNEELGLSDVSSSISFSSGFSGTVVMKKFFKIVFVTINGNHDDGNPNQNETIATLGSNLTPSVQVFFPTIAFQKDTAHYVYLNTSRQFKVSSPDATGDLPWYFVINGWFHID